MTNFAEHFFPMVQKLFILLILGLLVSSCGEYDKILKSTDFELKKSKALEMFDDGKYAKTAELLTQVLPRYRATEEAENLTWISANCYYEMHDYITAAAAYKNFADQFPYSENTEEANFRTAYCDYMLSPRPELDQAYTYAAIEEFTYFLNLYPNSDTKEEALSLISELEDKLVEKSYLSAKLYYDMNQYKAAIVALSNSLKEYPETKHREELMFLKLESAYLYAFNSVSDKQRERYQSALDVYYSFVEEFPESKFSRDTERIHNNITENLGVEKTKNSVNNN